MAKRSQMRKRFGRRNFKQRYFRLTSQSLSYAKAKGKRTICDIPLSEILGVERLSEDSFKMQNVFQVSASGEVVVPVPVPGARLGGMGVCVCVSVLHTMCNVLTTHMTTNNTIRRVECL